MTIAFNNQPCRLTVTYISLLYTHPPSFWLSIHFQQTSRQKPSLSTNIRHVWHIYYWFTTEGWKKGGKRRSEIALMLSMRLWHQGVSEYLSFCFSRKYNSASMCKHCSNSKAAFCLKMKKSDLMLLWFKKTTTKKESQVPHNAFKSLKWFLHLTQLVSAV